jgi:hypothetical protein
MDQLVNALISLSPALIVFAVSYFLLKEFFYQENKRRERSTTTDSVKVILPLRLQAYERIVLFLERITPNQLVTRLMDSNLTAREYHRVLIKSINEEFNHNISQQLYVSSGAWEMVKSAKEKTITQVNSAYGSLGDGVTALDLSQKILETNLEEMVTFKALNFIKEEVRGLY